ncbi:MAG: glycosyltransferase family 4 protein [Phycisphaerae bacterium]|nr:glycosyltransferase family 4 protein [Phycisphaerae bacterium]
MKVFMLGWEFPPFISGGLGTACLGLTKAMDQIGLKVTFVLPRAIDGAMASHVKLLSPSSIRMERLVENEQLKNVRVRTIDSPLLPYSTPESYQQVVEEMIKRRRELLGIKSYDKLHVSDNYSGDMYTEIHRYAAIAAELAKDEDFDVVHAHDWMTFPAGMAVSAVTGRPLVLHVHATEFDRSGEHVNQMIYDIERKGLHAADRVITVSYYTRDIVVSKYGVCREKIEVVHNGVDRNGNGNGKMTIGQTSIRKNEKIVLFLGRITMQKGPEYFLQAAKKVLDVMDDVKFVMAGSGDMMQQSIELAAQLGIGSKVLFTGFLRGDDVSKIYKMADLFVMPSVSEPFGLVPLEALDNDIPVIISKQSGVSEVLTHALKVDFWDVREIANQIVAVLKYPSLKMTLQNHGNFEVRKLRWTDSAEKCTQVYRQVLAAVN